MTDENKIEQPAKILGKIPETADEALLSLQRLVELDWGTREREFNLIRQELTALREKVAELTGRLELVRKVRFEEIREMVNPTPSQPQEVDGWKVINNSKVTIHVGIENKTITVTSDDDGWCGE